MDPRDLKAAVSDTLSRALRSGSLDALARGIVDAGVAHACALGWARFDGRGWTTRASGAFALGEGAPLAPIDAVRVVFDLASLTKPMLAVAVAECGLDPRTPLAELLHEVASARTANVSIETLLAHRAGLEANLPLFRRLAAEPAAPRDALLVEAADARRIECAGDLPEEGFAPLYSDLGYVLAGEAVARARGAEDAGAVIGSSVVRALGLESELGTSRDLARAGVRIRERAAPTERTDWRGGVVRGEVHDENAWMLTGLGGSGHAGMFGTVEAVLAFGRYVYESRRALEWTTRQRAGGTLRAGFDGKSVEGSSAGERMGGRAFGHLGFTGTSLWIDPDVGVVVALLTNRVYPTRDSAQIRVARPLVHDALVEMALSGTRP